MHKLNPSWSTNNLAQLNIGYDVIFRIITRKIDRMAVENLVRRDEDTGYIIAWKRKYDFETGKFKDDTMTYGEARKKCQEMNSNDSDKTFWPEKIKPAPEWHILYD